MKSDQTATWKCTYCSKVFKYESEKRRHEQSHVPQFECKVCSKKFSFLSALRRHEKQHERTGSVQCNKCGGNFRDETLLKRHIQYAHKGTFSCAQCTTTFNSDLALKTHMKTHKAESERKYHCKFHGCEKAFNFAHHLKHHELTHTDTKQFFCKECGKGFIQSHHLKVHMKTHNPDCWLPCSEPNCNKKFVNEYARKRHLATHKNLRTAPSSNAENEGSILCCLSCGQFLPKPKYYKHILTCIPETEKPDFSVKSLELSINEISKTINDKAEDVQLNNNFKPKIRNEDNKEVIVDENLITDCKNAIGSCISDDNCICAQIKSNIDEFEEIITTNENLITVDVGNTNKSIVKLKDDLETQVDDNNIYKETPEIEYRFDGTIKIKGTCDVNLIYNDGAEVLLDDTEDISSRKRIENLDQDTKLIPFSTCKDVLGNCIVSGNGTIGEECLCAKMVVDDQLMSAQEIEEITPCPKNTWLSQRL